MLIRLFAGFGLVAGLAFAQDADPKNGSKHYDEAVQRWEKIEDAAGATAFLESDGKFAIRVAHREVDLLIKARMLGLSALTKPFATLMEGLEAKAPQEDLAKLRLHTLRSRYQMALTLKADEARDHFLAQVSLQGAEKAAKTGAGETQRESLQQALKVMERLGDPVGQVDALEAIATADRIAGRREEASRGYEAAASAAAKIGDGIRAGNILKGASLAMMRQGLYQDAERLLNQAYGIAKAEGDRSLEAETLNAYGILQVELRKTPEAVKAYEAALAALKTGADRVLEAVVIKNLASLDDSGGRTEQALARFEQARRMATELKLDALVRAIQVDTAALYSRTGRLPEAVKIWEEVLELHRKAEDSRGELSTLANLSKLYFLAGKDEETLVKTWTETQRLAREQGNPEVESEVLSLWGHFWVSGRKQIPEGIQKLLEAVKISESVRAAIGMREDNKQSWFAHQRFHYEVAALGLFAGRRHEDAFVMLERLRARNLQDALEFRDLSLRDVPPKLIEDRARRIQDYNTLRKERNDLFRSASAAKDEAARLSAQTRVKEKDVEIEKIEEALTALERDIQGHQRIEETSPATFAEVQACLAKDEALVLYTAMTAYQSDWDKRTMNSAAMYIGCLITRESIDFAPLDRDEQVADDIAKLRRGAIASGRGYPVAAFKTRARRLYEVLMKPAEAKLERLGIKRLTIVPDDTLYSIPFEALLRTDAGDDYASLDYLGRRFDIDYVYSATLLARRRAQKKGPATGTAFVGFGDPDYGNLAAGHERGSGREDEEFKKFEPERGGENWVRLPQSGVEVEKVSELFKDHRVLLGKAATEGAAKLSSLVKGARVIHFACHGYVPGGQPMKAALVLTADEGNDGFLEAREIADLKLPVELVVLSACDSGVGEMIAGEGLIGLTRALMLAGAESVMSSLWTVADEGGREFMVRFYTNWTGGKERVAALGETKRALMAHPRYSAPYYWAGFVLHGP